MNFLQAEKRRQTEWKLRTGYISQSARRPGLIGNRLYPFCLPVDHASENLFAGIRDGVLAYFLENNITWHKAALPGYPSNHLCSSQVFLVNFLGPFQWDREGTLVMARHMVPDVHEILPIEQPDQYLAFEWVPPVDLLQELSRSRGRRKLTRGVGNTSMDFAFLGRTQTGQTILVLGESKYTEHYPRRPIDPILASKRLARLNSLTQTLSWLRAESVIDQQLLTTEPVYQLLRHHIMAVRLKESFPRIDDVCLVHLFVDRTQSGSQGTSPVLEDHAGLGLLSESPITFHEISAQGLTHSIRSHLPARFSSWRDYMEDRYRL